MLKIVFCLRRRAGMSLEDFDAYWRETHAPLVAGYKDVLRIDRYVQSTRTDSKLAEIAAAVRGAPEPYDGVAELWYASWEDLDAGFSTEEGRAAGRALIEDERQFIDLANSPIFFTTEREIVG
ncbi:MAG: EthD domain-containing protein [Alphaproteobacteria bacterium]|nr:EthD domain-containing protein [Alphaproteobacteria bacterium]